MKKNIYSYGKINLALNVYNLRSDNYHEIESIVFPISLCDEIEIDFGQNNFLLQTNISNLKITPDNFIIKIIHEMEQIWGFETNATINIKKKIPLMAGLGGGSSNAAAIMKALVCHYQLNCTDNQLSEIGQKYSCDIPFFIRNKPALVKSAGEEVLLINTKFQSYVLLVKPSYGISSKEAYATVDTYSHNYTSIPQMLDGLIHNDYKKVISAVSNNFLYSNQHLMDEYQILLPLFLKMGFDTVSISGTGSCFFALTQNKNTLLKGYHFVKQKYPFSACAKTLLKD